MDIIKTFKEGLKPQNPIIQPINVNSKEVLRLAYQIAIEKDSGFQITKSTNYLYKLLVQYFTGDSEFEKQLLPGSEKFGSLSKGLFLIGPTGHGKTFLLKYVFKILTSRYFRKNSYRIFNYMDILDCYANEGGKTLNEFKSLISHQGGIRRDKTNVLLIDDLLSQENTVNYFQNKKELADVLIAMRYEVYQKEKKLTHITTNHYANELKELLDDRSISRISEMFNIIEFVDKDWRRL
jgi:DNA replication protein DnaC